MSLLLLFKSDAFLHYSVEKKLTPSKTCVQLFFVVSFWPHENGQNDNNITKKKNVTTIPFSIHAWTAINDGVRQKHPNQKYTDEKKTAKRQEREHDRNWENEWGIHFGKRFLKNGRESNGTTCEILTTIAQT